MKNKREGFNGFGCIFVSKHPWIYEGINYKKACFYKDASIYLAHFG